MLPLGIFKNEHLETFFSSVSENQVSVSQARLEFTQTLFKIFNENEQIVGDKGGGMATELSVVS